MPRSFLSHAAAYGLAAVLVQAAGFVLLPLYTRCLGPEDYGVLEIVTRLSETASTLLLIGGFCQALFALHNQAEDEAQRRRAVCAAYLLLAGFCGVGGGLLLWLAPALLPSLDSWTLRLGILTILLEPFSLVPLSLMQARTQSLAYAGVVLGQFLVRVGLAVALVALLGMGAAGALASVAITGAIFGLALSVIELRRGVALPAWADVRAMLSFALPLVPSGLCFFLLHHGDRFFLLRHASSAEVGVYGLGYRLAMMAAVFGFAPLFKVWSARMYEEARRPDRARAFGAAFTRILALYGLAGLGVSLFAAEGVALLAGEAFAAAASFVPLVVLACGCQSAATLLDTGLFIARRPWRKLAATVAATAVTLVLYAVLIPPHGALGAAWATLGGFAFLMLATFALAQPVFPVEYEWGRLAGLASLFGLLALAASVQPWGVPGKLLLCAAAPSLMMAALATDEERASVFRWWPTARPVIAGGETR
ncbi:MAG: lipopolysaccharide biosynthesis protein [Gemmataceae bacterium]|nr:lipopolysaccharide biosynthesis protein [Gemmataceae bacterium]